MCINRRSSECVQTDITDEFKRAFNCVLTYTSKRLLHVRPVIHT